ncbi:MAG TPA: uroporphyrinogen-III C-methyltransferase [Myxococcota bacterium]|nr:uroporphyrinogen-III C-methyltransferase [Myxococcota bacterium]
MSGSAPGTVYLVGAGPGDPDLVTVRGAECLRRADAVVHDALVPRELLDLAPERALRIDVGKRGHDLPTRSQEEINALLVRLAREGRSVVRLKGGDPFVFGRGGEEASACRAAGVPFEVVPGVSAAVGALAYAGIPLTDRRCASSFTVVTGHKDPTPSARETRWGEIATGADTLVVLMGMRGLEGIVAKLVAGGRSPETPAAAVSFGATPRQRVVVATLAGLAARVRESGLASPGAVVVGDVVRLREELAWFEARPLFGLRVLVTRPADQAGELAARLRAAGAEPVLLPLVEIVPLADLSPLDAALEKLGDWDALVLTSRNAARIFAERWSARRPRRAAPPAWCVGPATARAALGAGLAVRGLPDAAGDASTLLQVILESEPPAGRRFLLPCAEGARESLAEGLRRAGARVDVLPIYRTVPAAVDAAGLRAELASGALDALTFASPTALRAFASQLDAESHAAALRAIRVAIGPATAAALSAAGLAPDAVAGEPSAAGIVRALVTAREARGARSPS